MAHGIVTAALGPADHGEDADAQHNPPNDQKA
jgi:hypothetical protein